MADMELVIKIDENTYKMFKNLNQIIGILSFEKDTLALIKAVKNGTPLPKGHGRLIDADKTIKNSEEIYNASTVKDIISPSQMYTIRKVLTSAPTIIEADKTESENKKC